MASLPGPSRRAAGRLLAAAFASILCSLPCAARAEDAARASALEGAALARVAQGDRRVAIDLYEEAYAAAPRREYLGEMGKLYDELAYAGDARDVRLAIVYLERYLDGAGRVADRDDVEARLVRLRGWKAHMRPEPQPPPPPAVVPLYLLSYDPKLKYEVSVGPQGCTTPCTLSVRPGIASLVAKGPGEVNVDLVVPPHASEVRLQATETPSTFIAGAVLTPLGLVMGAGLWAIGLACADSESACAPINFILWPTLGGTMMITGIILLARGRNAPPPDANRIELVARGEAPFRLTSVGVAPALGGGGIAGATFEF